MRHTVSLQISTLRSSRSYAEGKGYKEDYSSPDRCQPSAETTAARDFYSLASAGAKTGSDTRTSADCMQWMGTKIPDLCVWNVRAQASEPGAHFCALWR